MRFFAFILLIPLFAPSLAVPVNVEDRGLLDPQNSSLFARQLLGALRMGGNAASKVPDKAGKQVGKETGDRSRAEATVKLMAANFEKMGRPQNMKCLEGMVEHMLQWGGANMVWPCDKKDPKQEEKDRKFMETKKKAFASANKVDPNSIGAKSAAARQKIFGGKK